MYLLKVLSIYLLLIKCGFAVQNSYHELLEKLQLPAGFSISIYADNVPNARSLVLGDSGVFTPLRMQMTMAMQKPAM